MAYVVKSTGSDINESQIVAFIAKKVLINSSLSLYIYIDISEIPVNLKYKFL